jgi:hypothetical protein
MFETIVHLRPRAEWRPGMTVEKLVAELDAKTALPGVQGAWTMPIKARIDMLSTGIRTPIGIKVFGPDLRVITQINDQLERVLRTVPHTRSVYAERELGGFFIDVTPDREQIARYGLTVAEVLDVVESSIGGMDVATTYEGRERYKINVRYPRELRDNLEKLREVLVPINTVSPRFALVLVVTRRSLLPALPVPSWICSQFFPRILALYLTTLPRTLTTLPPNLALAAYTSATVLPSFAGWIPATSTLDGSVGWPEGSSPDAPPPMAG